MRRPAGPHNLQVKKRAMGITLVLAVLVMSTAAFAAKYGYEIDPEGMKALEAASSFPVKIIEKKVVEECLDVKDYAPADVLSLTVTNGSDDEISALGIKFVAYDESSRTQNISGGSPLSLLSFDKMNESPEIYTLAQDGLTLKPGAVCVLSTAVDYSSFTGARAMVEYYVRADGTKVDNPDFAGWQNMAYGLSSEGNMTVLD